MPLRGRAFAVVLVDPTRTRGARGCWLLCTSGFAGRPRGVSTESHRSSSGDGVVGRSGQWPVPVGLRDRLGAWPPDSRLQQRRTCSGTRTARGLLGAGAGDVRGSAREGRADAAERPVRPATGATRLSLQRLSTEVCEPAGQRRFRVSPRFGSYRRLTPIPVPNASLSCITRRR